MGTKHRTHRNYTKVSGYDKKYVSFVRSIHTSPITLMYINKFGVNSAISLFKDFCEGKNCLKIMEDALTFPIYDVLPTLFNATVQHYENTVLCRESLFTISMMKTHLKASVNALEMRLHDAERQVDIMVSCCK